MRAVLFVSLSLMLAACDSGTVPSPAEGDSARGGGGVAVAENVVDLRPDGLAAGSEAFYFAAGRSEVEGALARTLGEAMGRSTNAECGAGPIDFTDFPGGLAVHFQGGRLVGWNWRLPQEGDSKPAGTIRLADGDVAIGSARSVAQSAPGFARITASTLGEEFSLGPSIGGFIENDAVSMLYSGTQCFFR
ncbi:MAG: aspartate-semialdehyde dehydrogenase [Erythrobacter sp.]